MSKALKDAEKALLFHSQQSTGVNIITTMNMPATFFALAFVTGTVIAIDGKTYRINQLLHSSLDYWFLSQLGYFPDLNDST